jgi:Holliday junction resolvase
MKDWKACERKVATLLGGIRVPVSGRSRGHSPDIQHECLSIEVKSRKKLPAWIEDAMKQAEASAKNGQLPVTVLHQDGRKYRDSFVVCQLRDFAGYLKERSA